MAKKAKTSNGTPATAEEKPKKRAKQGFLPDMEPPSIPEIDGAADLYVDTRDARMALLKKEVELRDVLQAAMKKHKLTVYEYDGRTVSLEGVEKIKVRRKKADSEDGDSDE